MAPFGTDISAVILQNLMIQATDRRMQMTEKADEDYFAIRMGIQNVLSGSRR